MRWQWQKWTEWSKIPLSHQYQNIPLRFFLQFGGWTVQFVVLLTINLCRMAKMRWQQQQQKKKKNRPCSVYTKVIASFDEMRIIKLSLDIEYYVWQQSAQRIHIESKAKKKKNIYENGKPSDCCFLFCCSSLIHYPIIYTLCACVRGGRRRRWGRRWCVGWLLFSLLANK